MLLSQEEGTYLAYTFCVRRLCYG